MSEKINIDELKGLYLDVQSHKFLKTYSSEYVVDFCGKLYDLESDVYKWWYEEHSYIYKGNAYFQLFRALTHDVNTMLNNLQFFYKHNAKSDIPKNYEVNDNVIKVITAFIETIRCIIYNEHNAELYGFTYNQYQNALKTFTVVPNEDGETYRCVNCIKEKVRQKLADYYQGEIDKHNAGSTWYYTKTAEYFKKEVELLRSGIKITQNYLFED